MTPKTTRLWLYRFGFIGICLFSYFMGLLPFKVGSLHWHAPDLIMAFAFAWVLRRPEYAPLLIVGIALLIADFLFTRPPGLFAAISLLTLEFIRKQEGLTRNTPFIIEWAMVSALLLSMAVIYRIMLAIFIVPSASLGLVILQQISTVVAYPFVVFFSAKLLKITKPSATEADNNGYAR